MNVRILNLVLKTIVLLLLCQSPTLAANHPYALVESSIKAGAYLKALHLCKKILTGNPNDTMARRYAAISLYFLGYIEPAEDAFRTCIKAEPGNYFDRLYLAHCAVSSGKVAEAGQYYIQALLISPNAKEAKAGLLICHNLEKSNLKHEQSPTSRESKS